MFEGGGGTRNENQRMAGKSMAKKAERAALDKRQSFNADDDECFQIVIPSH